MSLTTRHIDDSAWITLKMYDTSKPETERIRLYPPDVIEAAKGKIRPIAEEHRVPRTVTKQGELDETYMIIVPVAGPEDYKSITGKLSKAFKQDPLTKNMPQSIGQPEQASSRVQSSSVLGNALQSLMDLVNKVLGR